MSIAETITSIPFPELEIPGFNGTLRNYQKVGVSCMILQPRFLLADDMGVGKTIETIAACSYLKAKGKVTRVLVICPSSVTFQWRDEIELFTRDTVTLMSRDRKKRKAQYGDVHDYMYTIVSYKILVNDFDYISHLAFDTIVLDEATAFKNHQTHVAKAVKELSRKATRVYPLTGTPIQNNLMELHSIMEAVDPGVLGEYWNFRSTHCIDKEFTVFRHGKVVKFKKIVGFRDVDKVVEKMLPYFIKRKAEDVIDELPPLVTKDYWLGMLPGQKKVYKDLLRGALETPQGERRVELLTKLTFMLECCDSPYLLGLDCRESSKVDELERLLTGELQGKKVVVFSRFSKMWELLESMFSQNEIVYRRIIGPMGPEERDASKKDFQNNPDVKVLLMSEAGEMGLNLTRGEYLVCVDQMWNPERIRQLVKRLQRMGQVNPIVFVINLWIKNSVEDHVRKVLDAKRELINAFEGKGKPLQMTDEEIMDIIRKSNDTVDSV